MAALFLCGRTECSASINWSILIGRLWRGKGFREQPDDDCLVANKNATTLEALMLYEALSGNSMEVYIQAAAAVILARQVDSGACEGATVHAGTHQHGLTFGIYTARCVAAMVRLIAQQPDPRYLGFIKKAVGYLSKLVQPDSTVLGHYKNGQIIAAPCWISPSGDLLRALLLADPYVAVDQSRIAYLVSMLMSAQYVGGGIPTAKGFSALGRSSSLTALPEFRDVLPVVGWCDKAFRALTMLFTPRNLSTDKVFPHTRVDCIWCNRRCWFEEDKVSFKLTEQRSGKLLYHWHKGKTYPEVMTL
jgi:hypothetical protein